MNKNNKNKQGKNNKPKTLTKKINKEVRKDVNKIVRSKQPTAVGRALRLGGGLLGSAFGMGGFGSAAGAAVSKIFGQGDYFTNAPKTNSLFNGGPPSFGSLNSGFRIKHREYIKDVSTSIAFNSEVFQINPGLPALFPWLSQIAPNFETYRIHGLCVYLNSNSAVAVSSTNTALGVWGLVTQYDPTEADFTTKQQCENYEGAQAAVPSKSILHGIECKFNSNVLNKFYVRTGAIPSTEDLKFYDAGKIEYFTQGAQLASVAGEMWVTYDIEFFKPRIATGGPASIQFTDYYSLNTAVDGIVSAAPLGTAIRSPYFGSNLGTSIDGANDQIIIPSDVPEGDYILVAFYIVTSGTTTAPTITASGGVSARDGWEAQTVAGILKPSGATSTHAVTVYAFHKQANVAGALTFSVATLPNVATLDIYVTKIKTGILPVAEEPTYVKLDAKMYKNLMQMLERQEELIEIQSVSSRSTTPSQLIKRK
jgi:hypothetical protein